jgi:CBS domain-containing protein
MRAQEIMSQKLAICYLEDDLNRAAQLMWEGDCGAVPVLDGEGHAVAMVTDRDICMAAYTQGKPLREIRVCSAMSKTLYSCRPDDSLEQVAALMRQHRVRRLPVLDREDRPVGIISLTDLLRVAQTEDNISSGQGTGVSLSGAAWTLAGICASVVSRPLP